MSDGEILELVTFNLSKEEFGVDIRRVQEINRMIDITRVPNAPYYVEGVVNLRGKIIPVVDLGKKLNLEAKIPDKATRIIVIELEGMVLGFIVDSVSEVLRIPAASVEPPPTMTVGAESGFIQGVVKIDDRLLILLDLKKTLGIEGVADVLAA
jgi:purine-binding chemotaxis protein CheW